MGISNIMDDIEIKVIYFVIFINEIKDTMDVMCSIVINYITEFKASIKAKTSVVNITDVFCHYLRHNNEDITVIIEITVIKVQ
jgi:hypothetical protein